VFLFRNRSALLPSQIKPAREVAHPPWKPWHRETADDVRPASLALWATLVGLIEDEDLPLYMAPVVLRHLSSAYMGRPTEPAWLLMELHCGRLRRELQLALPLNLGLFLALGVRCRLLNHRKKAV
jgi:hypothetical protein